MVFVLLSVVVDQFAYLVGISLGTLSDLVFPRPEQLAHQRQ